MLERVLSLDAMVVLLDGVVSQFVDCIFSPWWYFMISLIMTYDILMVSDFVEDLSE